MLSLFLAMCALLATPIAVACGVAADEESPYASHDYHRHHNRYYRNAPILPRHSLHY
ncbi:MAG: hypothetical protein IIW97_04515 [Alistipes sp.]|nr:hypothetical protein [Alistipes sp.]MEE1148944.1 hypothetical protein [Alistipes sp.]